jgi:hypothetical protein
MARYDLCPNCEAEMPARNLHCFACGTDIPPPRLDNGSILVKLYPAVTQAAAFDFYRVEATRLAAAGWYPVAIAGATSARVSVSQPSSATWRRPSCLARCW